MNSRNLSVHRHLDAWFHHAEVDTVVPGAAGHDGATAIGGGVDAPTPPRGIDVGDLDHSHGGPHGVVELGEVGNVAEHCSDKAHTRRQRQHPRA